MEQKIRDHLKNFRAEHGKTQKEMAEMLDVSYVTYQEMEKGIVKSIKHLNSMKEKTGFGNTQKTLYSDRDADHYISSIRDLSHSSLILSESNKTIAAANKDLAENNHELITLLTKFNLGAVKGTLPTSTSELSQAIHRIAHGGVPELWKSPGEGLLILGRLLSGVTEVKKQEGNLS